MGELEATQTSLREKLLRISGAIQVLEEAIAENSETDKNNQPVETVNGEEATTAEETNL